MVNLLQPDSVIIIIITITTIIIIIDMKKWSTSNLRSASPYVIHARPSLVRLPNLGSTNLILGPIFHRWEGLDQILQLLVESQIFLL